jgi:hypothetical protein
MGAAVVLGQDLSAQPSLPIPVTGLALAHQPSQVSPYKAWALKADPVVADSGTRHDLTTLTTVRQSRAQAGSEPSGHMPRNAARTAVVAQFDLPCIVVPSPGPGDRVNSAWAIAGWSDRGSARHPEHGKARQRTCWTCPARHLFVLRVL